MNLSLASQSAMVMFLFWLNLCFWGQGKRWLWLGICILFLGMVWVYFFVGINLKIHDTLGILFHSKDAYLFSWIPNPQLLPINAGFSSVGKDQTESHINLFLQHLQKAPKMLERLPDNKEEKHQVTKKKVVLEKL